jgi:hypothetical protein
MVVNRPVSSKVFFGQTVVSKHPRPRQPLFGAGEEEGVALDTLSKSGKGSDWVVISEEDLPNRKPPRLGTAGWVGLRNALTAMQTQGALKQGVLFTRKHYWDTLYHDIVSALSRTFRKLWKSEKGEPKKTAIQPTSSELNSLD